ADTNIYETDLDQYHYAYRASSRIFDNRIMSVKEEDLNSGEAISRQFLLSNGFGSIYYDPVHHRYLRVAQERLSEQEYAAKEWRKKQSLIILNDKFEIVGESPVDRDVALYSLFIDRKGNIFARVSLNNDM